jgi:hypothetical protein
MREIITRKNHKCTFCERTILKGSACMFDKGKAPRYDNDDNQIGIEFWKAWLCLEGDSGCIEQE